MKRIHYPGPIPITDLSGEPVPEHPGGPPTVFTFQKFARILVSSPKFVDGVKDPLAAMELVMNIKPALDRLKDAGGEVDIEDTAHKHLLAAMNDMNVNPAWHWCLLPYMKAIKEAAPPPVPDVPE